VFARTRHGADRLAKQLSKIGVDAVAMHGGRSQNQRNRALKSFSDGKVEALVATDVAARGIHVDDVATVVHYDPPQGHKDYLHRSGRTARAGASGTVVSLVTAGEKRATVRMQRNLDMTEPITPASPSKMYQTGAWADTGTPTRTSNGRKPVRQDRRQTETSRPVPELNAREDRSERSAKPKRNKAKHIPATDRNGSQQSVYVGNLPWRVRDDELSSLLAKYGTVHNATVKMDRRGRSKGVGFVTMSRADASKAVHELNGHKIGGRPLKVRFAESAAPKH
jgi:superfamily II DNA/RNA helicase